MGQDVVTQSSQEMSIFAQTILAQKYAHDLKDGGKETWHDVATRVGRTVLRSVNAPKSLIDQAVEFIAQRKFIPGGRYLYATGRPFHQVQNCLLLKAEDSREGWSELMQKITMALMTGAGIGVDYSDIRAEGKAIRKTGGVATGPLALACMINEAGRGIMQGGSRRSAIWAGLSWSHPDVMKFIAIKNWIPEVRSLKERDFNFPATLDGTNISVQLNDEFFRAYNNEKHSLHGHAHAVYWAVVGQMLKTAEPGFSIDTGENAKETLRNACVPAGTEILTRQGYQAIDTLVGQSVDVWNGFEWSEVKPMITGTKRELLHVVLSSGQTLTCTPNHVFVLATDYMGGTKRVEASDLEPGMKLIKATYPVIEGGKDVDYAYTQGFISAEGMDDYSFFFLYDPKKMCAQRMMVKVGKHNTNYDRVPVHPIFDKHPKSFVPFQWSVQSRLDWMAGLLDGDGCLLKEGGVQIASVNLPFLLDTQKMLTTLGVASKVSLATHAQDKMMPDGRGGSKLYPCKTLYRLLIGSMEVKSLHELGMRCTRLAIGGFTPNRNAGRFVTVVDVVDAGIADTVYCFNEPKRHLGCFDGVVTGQCTEVTSADDSDICNLGSINMARVTSLEEMKALVEVATAFLLAGTVYSDVPYAKVDMVRTKNRRLGLGLMGVHEWLLLNGKRYGADADLDKYLEIYATSTDVAAQYANKWDLSKPVKTRAIAPTGTIGILAETSTGLEPLFCAAFKRRYAKGSVWNYQYVLDPTAKRLIEEQGVAPESIEDAYVLAEDVERRVAFQAHVQKYVDHAISSTINLPQWGSELNNSDTVQKFGKMLIKYLPQLRGITTYPDGSRGGQPLTPVKYQTAVKHVGQTFVEAQDICDISKGGSCGS